MLVVGRSLDTSYDLSGLYLRTESGFSIIKVFFSAAKFVLYAVILYSVLSLIFHTLVFGWFYGITRPYRDFAGGRLERIGRLTLFGKKRAFFCIWGIIFVCWLPYYLMYFPAIITYDTTWQFDMIVTGEYSAHHPLLHTLMMYPFIKISYALGSMQTGVALLALFQSLFMSASFAFAVFYLGRRGVHPIIIVLVLAYFALFPINGYYSISPWKDQPFSCSLLFFTIAIAEIIRRGGEFFRSKRRWSWFLLSSIGVLLFRNNGLYVAALSFPLLLIFLRGVRKQIFCGFAVCAAVWLLFTIPVYKLLNVEKGSPAEALSIPLQQLARVAAYHWDELSEEDKAFYAVAFPGNTVPEKTGLGSGHYNGAISGEDLAVLYDPNLSDPIKANFNDSWYAGNKAEFYACWAKLFLKYPLEYVESFLCGGRGYWDPEVLYWTVLYIILPQLYFTEAFDISRQAVIPGGEFLESVNFGNWPRESVIGMMFSIGFNFWVFIVCTVMTILKRQARYLLAFLPVFLLWLTCLASPVYAEFRYIYGLFVCLPVLLPTALSLPKRMELT
jgi:hypothetical protein